MRCGRLKPGVGGTSIVRRGNASGRPGEAHVCRVNRLGFLRGFGGIGLTKPVATGGGENIVGSGLRSLVVVVIDARFSANPLAFLGFRGDGDVMGRSNAKGLRGSEGLPSDILRSSRNRTPNDVGVKDERGIIVIGDSGDEEGDGSVNADESAVEMVVVGDESVDSDVCVDVESRCWCDMLFSVPRNGTEPSAFTVPAFVLSASAAPWLSILV